MRYTEILEACWTGYQQQGMKKKGDRMVPNCVPVSEQEMEEDLKKWFKEKWVRFGPDGKIRGDCARGSESEGKPKCLPQSKAHALGKKGRASAAAKKRREDPDPERRGPAKNVATKVKEDTNPKFEALIKNIQARLKKDDYQRPELMKRVAQMVQQADPTVQDAMTTAQQLVQQYGQGPAPEQTHIGGIKIDPTKFKPGETPQGINAYWQAKGQAPIYKVQEQNDWDDADEFGMPGSEFFPDDDRLRDGDYVRDSQDGEYGEIFRMSGDPSERRVRILDRDGRGWYISPERLVAVDRNDPDIMKYFGKRRQRDMDESGVSETVENVRAGMAEIYRRLAPKIERHRDSFLAGQLYDELENYAELHGAEGEFKRMMSTARNRAHMEYDTNPGGFQNWFWFLPFEDEGINEGLLYSGDTWQDVLYRINVLNDIFGDQKDLAASFEPASQPEWGPFRDRILRSRTVLDTYAKVKQLANMNVPLTDTEIEMLADVAWDGGGGPVEPAGHWGERDYDWLEDLYAQQFAIVQHLLDQKAQGRGQNTIKSGQTVHEQGVAEAVTLDRTRVSDYPRDPATVKHRTDTVKAILSDPRSDPVSRRQASAILAGLKQIDEKQDACYRKVKSRYKVWPSAYASGALVQCRKKGTANWGNKTKK